MGYRCSAPLVGSAKILIAKDMARWATRFFAGAQNDNKCSGWQNIAYNDQTIIRLSTDIKIDHISEHSYLWEGTWVCLVSNEAERDKIGNETTMSRMPLRRTMGNKPKLAFRKLPMSRPNPKAMQPITHMVALRRD